MANIFRSDETSSPYIKKTQGFSLRQGDNEIRIQNLMADLEVNILTDLDSVSERYSGQFMADTNQSHRFHLPPDYPYVPLLVYVKPDSNVTLTGILHISFEGSSFREYELSFSPTFEDKDVPSPFRRVDSFTYMAWELPSRPVYFNLTVMVTGPFADGKSRAVHVNYTVAIYPTRCRYWDMEENKWLEEGCKVRTMFLTVYLKKNNIIFYFLFQK